MAAVEPSHALASDLAAVVARLRQVTVEVRTAARGHGSGVIWRADGLVVTSAHVLAGARGRPGNVQITLADRRRLPATVVGWSRPLDLALLRVEAHGLSAAAIGDSDALRAGELLLAVGHPFGLAGAAVTGVVHAASRPARGRAPGWIQADLRLAPGNSGGPLADAGGRVVGINAMIAGGVALAVPSRAVQDFVTNTAGS